MTDRDRRMHARYQDLGSIEVRPEFPAFCDMWTMIGVSFKSMNVVAELDESITAIVGGLDVLGLTNNASFEEL